MTAEHSGRCAGTARPRRRRSAAGAFPTLTVAQAPLAATAAARRSARTRRGRMGLRRSFSRLSVPGMTGCGSFEAVRTPMRIVNVLLGAEGPSGDATPVGQLGFCWRLFLSLPQDPFPFPGLPSLRRDNLHPLTVAAGPTAADERTARALWPLLACAWCCSPRARRSRSYRSPQASRRASAAVCRRRRPPLPFNRTLS